MSAPARIPLPHSAEAPAPVGTDDKIGRDDRSALVCCHEPSYRDFLHEQLRLLGFKVHHAAGAAHAMQRQAMRTYEMLVVLENLEGCTLENNAVLKHLHALPTDDRRPIYATLLGQSFATGDEMNTYAQSVDLFINYQDISRFAELLGPAWEEHEAGNRHFNAIWQEVCQ